MQRFIFPNILVMILLFGPVFLCRNLTGISKINSVEKTGHLPAQVVSAIKYKSLAGIVFEIPEDWRAELVQRTDNLEDVVFISPDGSKRIHSIIARRSPMEYQNVLMQVFEPNEAGFMAHWMQTDQIGEHQWDIYVWAQTLHNMMDGAPSLVMHSFIDQSDLAIQLSTDFQLEYQRIVETSGLLGVLRTEFASIWYMAENLHIDSD